MLKSCIQAELLEPIDLFFAERMLQKYAIEESEDLTVFFALLMAVSRHGHVTLTLDPEKLISQVLPLCTDTPNLAPALCHQVLKAAAELPEAIVATVETESDFPMKPICRFHDQIYLQKNWVHESRFLFNLKRLSNSVPHLVFEGAPVVGNLNAEQKSAIEHGMQHTLSLITGGPGTGKTYTAAHLVHNCLSALSVQERLQFRIVVAAPTGKAVAQLEKNIQYYLPDLPLLKSGTLHALLQVKTYKEQEAAPPVLLADLIIVDECSMIDAALFALLSEAVINGGRLVLIGDADQLPPVEAGSFFADLIDAAVFPVTHLKQSLRMERQEIIETAVCIQRGDVAAVWERMGCCDHAALKRVDLNMKRGQEGKFNAALWSYVHERFLKPALAEPEPCELLATHERFRILCCMRQGAFGVDAVNQILFQRYMQECPEEGWLAVPILITRNDYAMQLYNGDTGFLVKKAWRDIKSRRTSKEDYALFPDKNKGMRRLAAIALPPFEYAYCLSVHKSQGSEYDEILLLAPDGSEVFGKEVLYTAVTRARYMVAWDGTQQVIERAVHTSSRKRSGVISRLHNRPLA